jgi:hypothetical protein
VPFEPGFTAQFSFNGTDISAFTKAVKFNRQRKEFKLSRLGGNQIAKLVGPVDNMITLNGWQSSEVATLLTAEQDVTVAPTSKAVVYKPQGTNGGTRSCNAFLITYDEDTDADQAGTWSATLAVDGAVTDS